MKTFIVPFFILLSLKSFCQSHKDTVDDFSRASCYAEAYNENKPLWNATGFFFVVKDKTYFITNNHVVGAEYFINEYVEKHGHRPPLDSIPDRLELKIYTATINQTEQITLPLVSNNHNVKYIKFNNTANPNDIMDVVAIPTPDSVVRKLHHTIGLSKDNMKPGIIIVPTTELFIVGFPFDYGKYNTYPIWKRGTIASEPNLKSLQRHNFLIDASTRQGMSGSPVYFKGTLYHTEQNPNEWTADNFNTYLIGIYSAQNYSMEIGVVWDFNKVVADLEKLNP